MPDLLTQQVKPDGATTAVRASAAPSAIATRAVASEPLSLDRLEDAATELAQLAGSRIVAALGSDMAVEYKAHTRGSLQPTDPVTDVDREVEGLLAAQVAALFPGHSVLGEEGVANVFSETSPYTWLIDPVEGSQNFVHGMPLYGSCVAVLQDGRPVVGAIWTSTSHLLRAGVYHARAGGVLRFDGEPLAAPALDVERRRGLIAAATGPGDPTRYDARSLGSAAMECVLVASGALEATMFATARPWDIAAGMVLASAAGREIWVRQRARWMQFEEFSSVSERALNGWKRTVLIGTPEAARLLR